MNTKAHTPILNPKDTVNELWKETPMQYQYAPCVKAQSAEKRHARDQRMIEKSKSTYQRYNPHGARLGEKEGTG